jgi:hypothetical protein
MEKESRRSKANSLRMIARSDIQAAMLGAISDGQYMNTASSIGHPFGSGDAGWYSSLPPFEQRVIWLTPVRTRLTRFSRLAAVAQDIVDLKPPTMPSQSDWILNLNWH